VASCSARRRTRSDDGAQERVVRNQVLILQASASVFNPPRVKDRLRADRFSGAALVAKNGKTVFAPAYGFADREKKTPNTLKTRFRLGSMNKMFTAVATLQLVQSGQTRFESALRPPNVSLLWSEVESVYDPCSITFRPSGTSRKNTV
jgi:CubicO group peptidase (beta-lactamase class C family)